MKDMPSVLRVLGSRYGVTAVVLVTVPAIYGVAHLTRPGAAAGPGGTLTAVPLRAAMAACPAPGGGRVSVVSPPEGEKGGRTDLVQTATGTASGTLWGTGVGWFQSFPATQKTALTVRASGPTAAGLEAEQTTLAKSGDDRGLAGVRCAEPGLDQWFMGPGPAAAKKIDLYVTNVDDQPAIVDVDALSDDGPLVDPAADSQNIDPHSTKVIAIGLDPDGLGSLAGQATVMGVHVHVSSGRVAAAVHVRIDKGKGVDWLPAAGLPATSMILPAIPGGQGNRRLLVGVPGDKDAHVKVEVIGPADGSAPAGPQVLDAPAQTVTPMPLSGALGGKAAAVRLTSDHPILAGYTAELDQDVAYGGPAGALPTVGGAVADVRAGGGTGSTLILSAPGAAATVRLTPITAQGATGTPQTVSIPAGRTQEVRLTGQAGDFSIVAVPQGGPVYAGRVMTSGKFLTVLPLEAAPSTINPPPIGNSLTALVP